MATPDCQATCVAHRPRAVFLDRDGVLNRSIVRGGRPYPPANLDEFAILPGVEDACLAFKRAGLLLIVVTNQPDIARGKTTGEAVDLINAALREKLPLDQIMVCPHDDHMRCGCRKPKPGLLLNAAERFNIDIGRSVMVGDRWRDIAAGRTAGCHTIFIDNHYDEVNSETADHMTSSLAESLSFILAVTETTGG